MDNQTKNRVVKEIEYDIKRGIYDQFPVLKERLTHISKKLFTSIYVVNDDKQLSLGELETLIEADYLKRNER